MAIGLLASANLNTTIDTIIYTAPAAVGTTVLAKIFVCNRTASTIAVRLGLGNAGESSLDATNAIEFDVSIPPNGVLERGNILLGSGQRILARTNTVNVSVSICGIEN